MSTRSTRRYGGGERCFDAEVAEVELVMVVIVGDDERTVVFTAACHADVQGLGGGSWVTMIDRVAVAPSRLPSQEPPAVAGQSQTVRSLPRPHSRDSRL